ncbi:ABC transporter ATP-binding protein [Oxalicibacterium solurbis]|uniref:ABC transporter ATP-binding protein n=1 Tax=Oxalicibacterium solurbis TaxID=69280 RepID=A0A8J3B0A4_9BURK|nr:ABC transporter ATP-binding protein [Oxalicibacterium solurbis]GGI54771.1 ABC transporter ATP-binding protein [Oxalicibacterium solurbis]
MSAQMNAQMNASAGHVNARDVSIAFTSRGTTVQAVKSVSINVQPGEFVSIIGPSGCGKSTLMNAVAGFTPINSGVLTLDGKTIDGPGADRGVVFQQYSLFPWMTVRKNVEFGLKMQGMSAAQRESQARTLLGLAGLLAFENHYPSQLSGGMRQRVGIVRALATSPQVLLMDEPFGALDAQTRTVMQEILTNMWQRLRLSVLFITHDIEEGIFLSDRIYVMTARPGRVKAEIVVPLPRPRKPEMMESPEFTGLLRTIRRLIREESLAAMGGELDEGGCAGLSTEIGPEGVRHVL